MANYTTRKKLTYYLKLRVPKDLREHYLTSNGRPKEYLEESLKTRDKTEAEKRARKRVVYYEQEFAELRAGESLSNPVKQLEEDGLEKLRAYHRGEIEYPFGDFDPGEWWNLAVEHLPQTLNEVDTKRIASLYELFNNPLSVSLDEVAFKYLEERRSALREASWSERRQELEEFSSWIGSNLPVSKIKKKDAGRYVEYLCKKVSKRTGKSLAPKTIKDIVSGLCTMFRWAVARGLASSNPFEGMATTIPKRSTGKRDKREWDPSEITLFLHEAKQDKRVLEMFVIALYTGMRGREIAELKATAPSELFLQVDEAKNDNSIREVPVHPVIQPLVSLLRSESDSSGYLIKGLTVAQPDNNRYKNIGKKMGRLRAKLGIPKEVDFHSTRRAVAGACERAGLEQDRAARVLGHRPSGMTYGVYSGGIKQEQALADVAMIQYGDGVEEAVATALKDVYGLVYA